MARRRSLQIQRPLRTGHAKQWKTEGALARILLISYHARMFSPSGSRNNGAHFGETAWSVVLAAGSLSESRASEALTELCQMYWPPIYAYLRQRGFNRHDAQDLTQIFFQRIVQDETLLRASPARGRFRSFLLGALTRCLADQQAYLHAVKRGGGAQFISMDEVAAEEMHHQRVTMNLTPADSLDARWAGLLLERALNKVRTEFSANGKAETFEALSPFLAGEKREISYQDAAQRMGLAISAVKTHIHRLRKQFASAVRQEVMQTVSAPHEVDDELRQLRGVFMRLGQQQAL
jgi:RNA polymerase sigma-70 factor (ECF subfamily)